VYHYFLFWNKLQNSRALESLSIYNLVAIYFFDELTGEILPSLEAMFFDTDFLLPDVLLDFSTISLLLPGSVIDRSSLADKSTLMTLEDSYSLLPYALTFIVSTLFAICLTENIIGRQATLLKSVIIAMNGKTVEIGNMDAKEHLVLADEITYAIQKEKTTKIITVATLTGAVMATFILFCKVLIISLPVKFVKHQITKKFYFFDRTVILSLSV
ncbi:4866_t:CDS:2, partial [Acaulospora morrowiae]